MTQRCFQLKRLFLGLGLSFALVYCAKTPDPESVVATFQNQAIKVEAMQKVLRRNRESYDAQQNQSEAFYKIKQKLLNEMIDQKLLLQAALAQGVDVTESELDDEIEKYKSNYTEISFRNMLLEKGISYEEWQGLKRENLLISKFIKTQSIRELSEEEVRRYYQEHPSEFQLGERVHIRQIVTDSKDKAELILRRLQKGENFAKLAKELSLSPDRREGGDVGFIARGTFPREFEVCFSMNPGEISSIIPSAYGFHIFKVLEKTEAKTLSLEEVRTKIESGLKQKIKTDFVKELLGRLRMQANIKINEEVLKRISL